MKTLLAAVAVAVVLVAPLRRARAADAAAEAATAYKIDGLGSTSKLKVGETGKVVVAITPTAEGWKVHPDAPLKIRLMAPARLGLAKEQLGRADAPDPKAAAPRFETSFKPTEAGKADVTAQIDFFICSDAACVKQSKTLAIPVDVR